MSALPPPKTVALVDPLWVGHHPMYFGQFTASFLRAGARVIGLCPDPEAALAEVREAAADIPDFENRISMHHLPTGGRSWFGGRFEGDPWRTFQRWQRAGKTIQTAEQEAGWKADLVYFPYLDSYLRFLPLSFIPSVTVGIPWSGLYLRNHHHRIDSSLTHRLRLLAKGDSIIRSPLCRGIGVLDERFITPMENHSGQAIAAVPDATRTLLPEQTPAFTRKILEKAAGRKIIGLIGLEKRKGTFNMMRVALQAAEQRRPWYFVFAGTFRPQEVDPDNQPIVEEILTRLGRGELDSIHFDPDAPRIPTEPEFNALFSNFDVAWAAYENFHGSSGTLSKAAAFEIPSIATTGECIGQRVERYRTGLTIQEGDSVRALHAIEHLIEGSDWNDHPLIPDFTGFREAHSIDRLDTILSDLLTTV